MTTKIHNAMLSSTKELVQASVTNALEDNYCVSTASPSVFFQRNKNIYGRMLATNVDVPVFFCILIPSRNMVNRKGQLPPQSFQSQAHTHTVTEPRTKSTE